MVESKIHSRDITEISSRARATQLPYIGVSCSGWMGRRSRVVALPSKGTILDQRSQHANKTNIVHYKISIHCLLETTAASFLVLCISFSNHIITAYFHDHESAYGRKKDMLMGQTR